MIGDHSTLDIMHEEVRAFLEGRGEQLPPRLRPSATSSPTHGSGVRPRSTSNSSAQTLGDID